MSKQIKFVYNNTEYTLEYTKRTVEQMERSGLNISELVDKPVSMLPALFAGAFLAHHRFVKQDVINDIFEHMPNKADLVEKLVLMYRDPAEKMLDEPEENEGNVTWAANW